MTGKDLLEGLSFLDEKMIEELSREEKSQESGERSGQESSDKVSDTETPLSDNVIYRIRTRTRRRELRKAVAAAAAGMVVFLGGAAVGHLMDWGKKTEHETEMLASPKNADGNNDEYAAARPTPEQDMISVLSEEQAADPVSSSFAADESFSVCIDLQSVVVNLGTPHMPEAGKTDVKANIWEETEVYLYEQDQFTAVFQQEGIVYQITASDLKKAVQAAAELIYKGRTVIVK